ncbi:MAG: ribbon-helix-helix protein, CopG family [Solirubrobacteraceae bacterium]
MGGMVKTTVYLDERDAAALRRIAAETGRSQADIIREAISRTTRGSGPRACARPQPDAGPAKQSRDTQTRSSGRSWADRSPDRRRRSAVYGMADPDPPGVKRARELCARIPSAGLQGE